MSTPSFPAVAATPVASPSAQARRVIFVDLARALAVLFMLYGHTLDALLAPQYRVGRWFDVWQFQRGLTSSLFLILSGFAFSIATGRHWALHTAVSRATVVRMRRFALFIGLGYLLHFPAARVVDIGTATDAQWRSFLSVDVLQLLGATFIGVQWLVLLCRSRRVFIVVTLVLAPLLVATAPWLWRLGWDRLLPAPLAAYVSPAIGSLFPVIPWSSFVLLGAGIGLIYSRWGAARLRTYANLVLLAPGVVLAGGSWLARLAPSSIYGSDPMAFVPGEIFLRAGVCLTGLGLIAHASGRIERLPRVVGAVAQESLLIYFVHLCLVYGSVWNNGLAQAFGMALSPWRTVVAVVGLIVAMTSLAWYWNRTKHVRPRAARWITAISFALLLARLL